MQMGTIQCFGNSAFGNVAEGLALLSSLIMLFLIFSYHTFSFSPDPKNGGLFSCTTSKFQLINAVLIFGNVYAARMLKFWWFWRIIVVIISVATVLYFCVVKQLYHKWRANAMWAVSWSLFGCAHLGSQIGFLVFRGTGSTAALIVGDCIGTAAGIAMSVFVWKKTEKRAKAMWLLSVTTTKLFGGSKALLQPTIPNIPLSAIKVKNPYSVEPSTRFLQEKSIRTKEMLNYADAIYTHALARPQNRFHAQLNFEYGMFLSAYMKNSIKSSTLLLKCRSCSPEVSIRFVLFCKSLEMQKRGLTSGGPGGNSDLSSLTFKTVLSEAEAHHIEAKDSLKEMWENVISPKLDTALIPEQLSRVVEAESKARNGYEELLVTHPHSTQVLRLYGKLLMDIYNDVDAAEVLFARADDIEEDMSSQTMQQIIKKEQEQRESERLSPQLEADAQGVMGRGKDHVGETSPERIISPDRDQTSLDEERSIERQSHTHHTTKHMKGRRRRKKKKTGEGNELDQVVKEVSGDNRTSEKFFPNLVASLITLSHFVFFFAVLSAMFVFGLRARSYFSGIQSSKKLTQLSSSIMVAANSAHGLILHEYWNWARYDDANLYIPPVWQIGFQMGRLADSLLTTLSSVYSLTKTYSEWEEEDARCSIFSINATAGHHDVLVQRDYKQGLLNALTTAANKLQRLSFYIGSVVNTTAVFPPPMPTYYDDLMYLMYNAPQPFVESCKRALLSLYVETHEVNTQAIKEYDLIISIVGAASVVFDILLFTVAAKVISAERRMAYMSLLETPHFRIQQEIRRLFASDSNEEGDGEGEGVKEIGDTTTPFEVSETEMICTETEIVGAPQMNMQMNEQTEKMEQISEEASAAVSASVLGVPVKKHAKKLNEKVLEKKRLKREQENKLLSQLKVYLRKQREQQEDYDDEEVQKGILHNVIEDDEWEELVLKNTQNLSQTIKSFPIIATRSTILRMIGCVSMICICIFATVFSVVSAMSSAGTQADNLLFSGMRTPILIMIQTVAVRMAFPDSGFTPYPENFVRTTNPVWKGSEHMSNDTAVLMKLLLGLSDYFRAMHLSTHFGESPYTSTKDSLFDRMKVQRIDAEMNADLLLRKSECFLNEGQDCTSDKAKKRIVGVTFPVYGIETLFQRMQVVMDLLEIKGPSLLTPTSTAFRFLQTGCRYDMMQGLGGLDTSIMELIEKVINSATDLSLAMMFVTLFLMLLSLLVFVVPLRNSMLRDASQTMRLLDLLPVSEEEMDLEFTEEMKADVAWLDEGRMRIVSCASDLIAGINERVSQKYQLILFDVLCVTFKKVFEEEERRMSAMDWSVLARSSADGGGGLEDDAFEKEGEAMMFGGSAEMGAMSNAGSISNTAKGERRKNWHILQHVLIRQRLAMIGQLLANRDDSAHFIAKREIIACTTKHFLGEDMELGMLVAQLRRGDEGSIATADVNMNSAEVLGTRSAMADNVVYQQNYQ